MNGVLPGGSDGGGELRVVVQQRPALVVLAVEYIEHLGDTATLGGRGGNLEEHGLRRFLVGEAQLAGLGGERSMRPEHANGVQVGGEQLAPEGRQRRGSYLVTLLQAFLLQVTLDQGLYLGEVAAHGVNRTGVLETLEGLGTLLLQPLPCL